MTKIIVGMGLPGSGKTTTLSEFASRYGHVYVALDVVRKRLGLGEGDPTTDEVLKEVVAEAIGHSEEGRTVVIDGVFLNDLRKKLLTFLRAEKIEKIQGLFVDTPEDVAWERVVAREKDWDDKTPREMFDKRVSHRNEFPPSIADGFDSLFTLDQDGRLRETELRRERKKELGSGEFV